MYVKNEWFIEKLDIIQEIGDERRIVYLEWKEKGRLRNRAIRIWNLSQPWLEPIQQLILHNKSELTITRPLSELPPGTYRLEFFQEDQWATQPAQNLFMPEAGTSNTFDIEIGDRNELLERYKNLGGSFREQLEKLNILKLLKDEVRLIEQISQIKIESLSNENLKDLAILMISWLPDEDVIHKVWKRLDLTGNRDFENQFEDALLQRYV